MTTANRFDAPTGYFDLNLFDYWGEDGETLGYRGTLTFDLSRPDGMPRKLLDSSRLTALGWRASTPLREGIERTYAAFLAGTNKMHWKRFLFFNAAGGIIWALVYGLASYFLGVSYLVGLARGMSQGSFPRSA